MSATKDHMTAFKTSRLAQILMAPSIALVTMGIWATGRHFAILKVGSLVLNLKWKGDGLQLTDSASFITVANKLPCPQQETQFPSTNIFHKKGWLGLKGDPTGRVTLFQDHPPSRANFSPYKHFDSPSRVKLGQGETIRACARAAVSS